MMYPAGVVVPRVKASHLTTSQGCHDTRVSYDIGC
jgi:hypothetical protein